MSKTPKTTATKTVAELEAEREALRREIRAARRAEKKAAAAALADAQADLGRRVSEAVGATTPEAVQRLWQALDLDHIRATLAGPAPVQTWTTDEFVSAPVGAAEADHVEHTAPAGWSS